MAKRKSRGGFVKNPTVVGILIITLFSAMTNLIGEVNEFIRTSLGWNPVFFNLALILGIAATIGVYKIRKVLRAK